MTKRYRVQSADSDFTVDGAIVPRPAWGRAGVITIGQYPWRKPEDPPPPRAEARLLYSREALYVRFQAWERHVVARHVAYQDPVCTDSCVEFFVSPGGMEYLNVEISCIGTLLLFRCGPNRRFTPVPAGEVRDLRIATSLPTGRAIPDPVPGSADGYVVEYSIPFAFFTRQTGCAVPRSGTVWMGNFYKCCDRGPEPAWGSWSPVGTPSPDFHRPEYFGELRFD